MDNAKIHHAKLLYNLFSKLNIFFSAPYSPFLNPIEEVFGLLKHYLRISYKPIRYDLIKNIHKCLR